MKILMTAFALAVLSTAPSYGDLVPPTPKFEVQVVLKTSSNQSICEIYGHLGSSFAFRGWSLLECVSEARTRLFEDADPVLVRYKGNLSKRHAKEYSQLLSNTFENTNIGAGGSYCTVVGKFSYADGNALDCFKGNKQNRTIFRGVLNVSRR